MGEKPQLNDWKRILFGEVPAGFFVELLIRGVFAYLLLFICMRAMGKRMAGQLSRTEMVALVALAGMIGIPLQSPDRGLVPAAVIAAVIVVAERFVSARAAKNPKAEVLLQDRLTTLVDDGVLQLREMQRTQISRERLFAHLRSSSLTQLGKIKRVYLEASGEFTFVPADEPKPGLSLVPDKDPEFRAKQKIVPGMFVCCCCGAPARENSAQPCEHCGESAGCPAYC
jgi:uncharacterized membrane protein YcaP (DUF421 family)